MRIWIDLSNSPHPLLFFPVGRRLTEAGHEVLLTARDNAQTVELARERWLDEVAVIGGQSPRSRPKKLREMSQRIMSLRRWAASARPDVALSHNSYGQIVAARAAGIAVVTAMDYEHQPLNHLAFRLARTVLLPDILPATAVRRQGAAPRKVVRYPGLKEELYVGDFEPDPEILAKIGLSSRPRVLVVVRTPPSRAIYHPSANEFFDDVLRTVCGQDGVVCVALARHPEQVEAIEGLELSNCMVRRAATDSRSLMYAADAMIGAGGTMTREAALMGIPTWTLFAGKTPAADAWLEREGRLTRLTSARQVQHMTPRLANPTPLRELRRRAKPIEAAIVEATLAVGVARRGNHRLLPT